MKLLIKRVLFLTLISLLKEYSFVIETLVKKSTQWITKFQIVEYSFHYQTSGKKSTLPMNTFLTYESTLLIWELLSKRVLFSFIFWHIRKRTLLIWKLLSKRVLFSYTNLYSGKSTLLVPKRVWIITWGEYSTDTQNH